MLKLMGDPAGELTEALDMKMTDPGPASKGLFNRCKRHAIYAVNGEIIAVHVSEGPDDPAGDKDPSNTLAPALLKSIELAQLS
jgi:peroxiredoxin